MSRYSINLKTQLYEGETEKSQKRRLDFLKKCASSATYYFGGAHIYSRQKLGDELSKYCETQTIDSLEDIKKSMEIHNRPWKLFLEQLNRDGLIVRAPCKYNICWAEARISQWDWEQERKLPFDIRLPEGETEITDDTEISELQLRLAKLEEVNSKLDEFIEGKDKTIKNIKEINEDISKSLDEARDRIIKLEEQPHWDNTLTITGSNGNNPVKMDLVHHCLRDLVMRLKTVQEDNVHPYLIGPSGSGKTYACEQAAEALGINYGMISVGPQTTESRVFGYMSASGDYVFSEYRRCYESGGLFLFDEIDAGHGGVLTMINASLAGNLASFPDKMVRRHPDFRCVAAGNTYGTGPSSQYVGRQELDGASLNRFNYVWWPYDEELEAKIVDSRCKGIENEEMITKIKDYFSNILKIRKSLPGLGIKHIVSPRATMQGIALIKMGADLDNIYESSVWTSLRESEIERIKFNLGDVFG